MQQFVGVGLLVANFDGVAYGMMNHTTEAMHMQSAYMGDVFLDGAILATVLSPTREHPFRSTTLRWSVKAMPLHVRALSKHRDSVCLHATGTRVLATGEIIGYDLMQSVDHVATPPLSQYERSQISVCTLWRQVKPDRVQLVTRSYIILHDNMLQKATIKAIADAMHTLWKVVQCAQYKKLTWLVQNRKTLPVEFQCRRHGGSGCGVCGEVLSEARRSARLACAVCSQPTCKACRILIVLMFQSPVDQSDESRRRVCVACVVNANRIDARMIAQNEATQAQQQRCTLRTL